MYFQGHAAGFLKPKLNLSISEVWNIESHELSQHGVEVLKLLEAPESDLKSTYEDLVWYSQAFWSSNVTIATARVQTITTGKFINCANCSRFVYCLPSSSLQRRSAPLFLSKQSNYRLMMWQDVRSVSAT